MSQSNNDRFFICLFAATAAWYSSILLAFFLNHFHVAIVSPKYIYSMYWNAFYDAFCQHFFYMAFVIQGVLFGFFLRRILPLSTINVKQLIGGTATAILLMPLAAVGIYGISLAPAWPTEVPPLKIIGGGLWCIPGVVILLWTLMRGCR